MKNLLKILSVVIVIVGIALVGGGIWGICFTYEKIIQENIVTPKDATISEKPVRGPFTLFAQANVIRKHTLGITGGKTFAEMPREIAKLDEKKQPVLDVDGKPVMVANTARDIWITATTLITALNLGLLTYMFSGIVVILGFVMILLGIFMFVYNRNKNTITSA